MKGFIIATFCISLTLASYYIPLEHHTIKFTEKDTTYEVDEVLFAEATSTHVTGDFTYTATSPVVFDTTSSTNYMISRQATYNNQVINPTGIDCNGFCKTGVDVTTTTSVIGDKAQIEGGKERVAGVEIHDSKVNLKINFPNTVKTTTPAYTTEIFKFATGSISLSRSAENFVHQQNMHNKLVKNDEFSIYNHEDIAQINVGTSQRYFIQPNTSPVVLNNIDSKIWGIQISGIKIRDQSKFRANEKTVNAYFDTTTKYIWVPYIAPVYNIQSQLVAPAHYYFMDAFPAFKTTADVNQRFSYFCNAESFNWNDYQNINFIVKDREGFEKIITLTPEQYIEKRPNGKYELLFRFSKTPQTTTAFYLGTTFLNAYYTTFNAESNTITLNPRFDVDNGSLHLDDRYRLTIVIAGSILAIIAIVLLIIILKRIKESSLVSPNVMPAYQRTYPGQNTQPNMINQSNIVSQSNLINQSNMVGQYPVSNPLRTSQQLQQMQISGLRNSQYGINSINRQY